jgi:hypothetical protein
MKSERRQIGGRYLARARGAFRRRDLRPNPPAGAVGQPGAEGGDVAHTGAVRVERTSLAALLAPARREPNPKLKELSFR